MKSQVNKQTETLAQLATDEHFVRQDLEQAGRFYTSLCADTLDLERVSIWLCEDISSRMRCLSLFTLTSSRQYQPKPIQYLQCPEYLHALRSEWMIDVVDIGKDTRIKELRDIYLDAVGVRSLIHIGLKQAGQLLGIICFEHIGQPRDWRPDELGFVNNIAHQFSLLLLEHSWQKERQDLQEKELIYHQLFDDSEISIWEEDFSQLLVSMDELREQGIRNLRLHLDEHPEKIKQLVSQIRIVNVNSATLRIYEATSADELIANIEQVYSEESYRAFVEELCAIWEAKTCFRTETMQRTLSGKKITTIKSMPIPACLEDFSHIPVSFIDITNCRQLKNDMLHITQGISSVIGDDFFHSLVKTLCKTLEVDIAFVAQLNTDPERSDTVETVAIFADGAITENFIYDLAGTPCETVTEQKPCSVLKGVQECYPKDLMLCDMGIEAYSGIPLYDADGKVIGLLVVMNRSSVQNAERFETILRIFSSRAASELARMHTVEHLNKLSLAVQHSPNVVIITNSSGHIEYVNPKFTSVTGYSQAEVLGKTPAILKSGKTDDATYKTLWQTLLMGNEWRGELENRRKNGELYWAQEVIAPIKSVRGTITHFVAIQEDITESRRISSEIKYQASHDMLTGLINRHEFERRLKRVIATAQEDRSRHVLCFLDLDQFKVINDSSGHIAGDEMLRELSALFSKQLRQRDTLARIGGDEFAILMEHCGITQASHSIETLQKLVNEFRFIWEGVSFSVGVSIGMTLIDETVINATDVQKKADLACYAAKDAGRNRLHVYQYNDAGIAIKEGELLWVNKIRQALDEDHFCLYVQAIVSLADAAALRNYEVLIRLQTPDGKICQPGSFLPAAERYNLSQQVDQWVIGHLFMWLKQNPEVLTRVGHFAINLSGQSLGDKALLQFIITELETHKDIASQIMFEITETAAISNLRDATHFISTLRTYGCKFALDDFGSGLSSFAYLKNLQVDYLKIDGMFVKNILEDAIDEAMVRSINDIGHVMGMVTIAEFVENTEIQQRLAELDVDFVQGYGIGKPMPIEQLVKKSSRATA